MVELDGGQHLENAAHDFRRDERINQAGYQVVRFWNNLVFTETAAVMETILCQLHAPRPHPDFLLRCKCALAPQAEEGTL